MTDDWRDMMVGDRMAVDRQFSDRVADSEFTGQEWGLIMTAVEFRIESPGDVDQANLVADTTKVEGIADELDRIQSGMGEMGGAPGGPPARDADSDSGGFLSSVKDALGVGGGGEEGRDPVEVRRQADELTGEYADMLQQRLENEGRWEEVCAAAARAGEE